jgi:hypothetical protein
MNPHALCWPSQKGLFFDWPHRHSATVSLPAISNWFPSASVSVNGPVMSKGPFSRVRIVTSAIFERFLQDSQKRPRLGAVALEHNGGILQTQSFSIKLPIAPSAGGTAGR